MYNVNFPARQTLMSHVEDGSHPHNLDYIQSQHDVLREQRHEDVGHVPPFISLISSDNIIQQARYHVIAPNVRNSNALLHPYSSHGLRGPNDPHGYDHHSHGHTHGHHGHKHDIASTHIGPQQNYNQYIDYLDKQGLLHDNYKTRIFTYYLNIDSRYRVLEPSLTTEDNTLLGDDPLTFTTIGKTNLLTISAPNHNLQKDDKITLTGVSTDPVSIKALYQYSTKTGFSVIFENNRTSLVIKTDYATSVLWNSISNTYYIEDSPETANMSFDPNFSVGEGITYDKLKAYNTSDMFVELSGFTSTTGFIGNIPISFLNSTHRIYLTNPDPSGDVYVNVPDGSGIVNKITGFYILLPTTFNTTSNPPLTDTTMTIDINFKYIGGIPINKLNATLPISNNNITGYFTVYSTTQNTVNIKLNKDTYYLSPIPPYSPIPFGNSSVYISKVTNINDAFPQPNDYTIELPQSIHNIFMIKLVNTIIPNTSKTFKTGVNDKLYWQNFEDGTFMYTIQIPEGNYDAKEMEILLQDKMSAVLRNGITPGNGYTNKMSFDVSIDPATSIVSFKSYKIAMLKQPIQSVTDADNNPVTTDNPPYTLQIRQPSHGLNIGDTVLFSGFITTNGIPDVSLNTFHTVSNVLNLDNYEIVIDNINLSYPITDTKGGFATKVFVPAPFRLLFNESDTIGKELGFRKVGSDIAITNYGVQITNQDQYQNEIVITDPNTGLKYVSNETGQFNLLTNNTLQLNCKDYILMDVKEFRGSINVVENKKLTEYFAKINLSGSPCCLLYDTFVDYPILFYDMFRLQRLSIKFYNPDGTLHNFYGKDHSFVLELNTLELAPQESGINPTNNFV